MCDCSFSLEVHDRGLLIQMRKGNIMSANNNYGLGSFLLDVLMAIVTGGFWLIWVFIREMRRK